MMIVLGFLFLAAAVSAVYWWQRCCEIQDELRQQEFMSETEPTFGKIDYEPMVDLPPFMTNR